MFDPLPTDSQAQRPTAEEIFTDRVKERKLLREILLPVPTPPNETTKFMTVFCGVGGVGKSTLCEQAHTIIREHSGPYLKGIFVDFEHDSKCTPESGTAEVLGEIIRALAAQEVKVRLSLSLLTLHTQRDARNLQSPASVDEGWALAMDALDKVVEGLAFPGLNLGVKVLQKIWDKSARSKLREELTRHNLWPSEQFGKINLKDLEEKIARAIAVDITLYLKADRTRHLRLIIDGFERIQSRQEIPDGQKRLQQMLGWMAQSQDRDVWSRFRVVIFGRNCIAWDDLYHWDGWRRHWNTHLLKGLSEADALELLGKYEQWYRRNQGAELADAVRVHSKAILDVSDEQEFGQRVIYPYYIDLAVDAVLRCTATNSPVDLGSCPSQLEQRFFNKVLPDDELHLLKVLALVEDFDETLFDWLAQTRLISQSRGQFRSALGLCHHSYFRKCDPDGRTWQFHALFKKALQSKWIASEDDRRDGAKVVHQLLDYYGNPLKNKSEGDWTVADIESWRRGMKIISHWAKLQLSQLRERRSNATRTTAACEVNDQCQKLLQDLHNTWDAMLATPPWRNIHPLCRLLNENNLLMLDQEIFNASKELLGPDHPDTLEREESFAVALRCTGSYAAAEPFYRRRLAQQEKALGPNHPDTLDSIEDLARLLKDKGDYAEAEALYRRALADRENVIGREHPDTMVIMENLVELLNLQGNQAEAKRFYSRVTSVRASELGAQQENVKKLLIDQEMALGPNHPDTLDSVKDLARLLEDKGDYAQSEAFYRRMLAGKNKSLGLDHPDTLNAMKELAFLLDRQGNHAEAEKLYRQVLEGREKVLGPEDSDTLNSMNTLANQLCGLGNHAEAELLYRRALAGIEKKFGREHWKTCSVANSLAKLLETRGDHAGAQTIYRNAAARCRKWLVVLENTLGLEHPDTLVALESLAHRLLKVQGGQTEAGQLFRLVLAGQEKVLGVNHPRTRHCVKNLAEYLANNSGVAEAVTLLREYSAKSEICLVRFRYQLACYTFLSGNIEEAKRLIADEIGAKPAAREQALKDDDLKAIHNYIRTLQCLDKPQKTGT